MNTETTIYYLLIFLFCFFQEEDINNYIKDLYKGCDVENIEKFADGTISLTSVAKSKKKEFKFETEVRSPGSPSDRNSGPILEQKSQDRLRRRDIGTYGPKQVSYIIFLYCLFIEIN